MSQKLINNALEAVTEREINARVEEAVSELKQVHVAEINEMRHQEANNQTAINLYKALIDKLYGDIKELEIKLAEALKIVKVEGF